MTPKEKAEDLFITFYQRYDDSVYSNEGAKTEAKYCALICVDEIMDTIPSLDECKNLYIFWSQVKHELNKQD